MFLSGARRLRDTWSFVVAIVISIFAALALACGSVFLWFRTLMPRLRKAHRESIVLKAASHRLDHELPCEPLVTNIPGHRKNSLGTKWKREVPLGERRRC